MAEAPSPGPSNSAGRADEADRTRVFILGSQRSGTTWLQLLLGRHPDVGTVKETHLFNHYVARLADRWDAARDAPTPRKANLSHELDDTAFYECCRRFAEEVYDRLHPTAPVVLDKTPDHARCSTLIHRCFPDAFFIHLVRDPRDVTASLMAAAGSWGSHWAEDDAYGAAHRWKEHVRGARRLRHVSERFREIRYEDLYDDPARTFAGLLGWLDLSHDDDFVEEAVAATSLSNLEDRESDGMPWDLEDEPDDFFRKGGSGNWRSELSATEARTVEHVCRPLMQEYGYDVERERTTVPPLPVLRHRATDAVGAAVRAAGNLTRRVLPTGRR